MSNLRYNPNTKHLFIHLNFTMKNLRFGSMYLPWEDELHSIDILEVECVEHHKVAWDQDPDGKKEHDGFVFKDDDGRIWHNQYPRASYGQIDDSQNWVIRPGWEGRTVEDCRQYFTDVEKFLENVQRGLHELSKDPAREREHAALLDFFNQIVTMAIDNGYNVLVEKNTSVRYHRNKDSGAVAAQINNDPIYSIRVS